MQCGKDRQLPCASRCGEHTPELAGDSSAAALPGTKGRAAEDMLGGVLCALASCPDGEVMGTKGLAWTLGRTGPNTHEVRARSGSAALSLVSLWAAASDCASLLTSCTSSCWACKGEIADVSLSKQGPVALGL